jgi:thiol-disulfide isomerase/thioredoxin
MGTSKQIFVGRLHADWCIHCKSLKPEWAKMKKILSKIQGKYRFVSIEQSKEAHDLERLNKYLGIVEDDKKVQMKEGYPTIFKVVDGVVEYYNGPRMTQNLVNWVKETSGGTRKRSTLKRSIVKRSIKKRRTDKQSTDKRNTRRR